MRGSLSVVASTTAALALFCISASTDAATIIVTNNNDSGPGSLRQALANAQNGDTIEFAVMGSITLTSAELFITNNIAITGPGPGLLSVVRNGQATNFGIFYIAPNLGVTISGLSISGGRLENGNGAGIENYAALTLNNCIVSGNRIAPTFIHVFGGAGIYNDGIGTLTLNNSTVSGNDASNLGFTLGGGGIYNKGTLTITQSSISNNTSDNVAGGILNSSMLTMTNSILSNNHATGSVQGTGNGGGIANGGTMIIQNSTISGNSAQGQGGQGGGITNGGSLEVKNSTISGNTGVNGGGIYGGATIINSTFSGNSAQVDGGCIYATDVVELGNTILKAGSSGVTISSPGGTVISHGYNLSSDNGGGFLVGPGDHINTDPMLGPLQNNGGLTFTHALLPGSPAIDMGDPGFTPPPIYDQRGFGYQRVYNGRIDIGSVEVQPAATISPTPTATATVTPTATATATATSGTPTPTATTTAAATATVPPPTPTPCATFNVTGTVGQCTTTGPSGVALPGVTMTLSNSSGGGSSTTTDSSGNYFLSGFSCFSNTVTPSKAARAPGSPGIDTIDVVAVQRHFLVIGTPLSGCRLTAADVNGDSMINTVDVIAIQRFYLGQTTGVSNVGKYSFNPPTRSYSPPVNNQTNQNYDALVFGDVAPPFAEP